MAILAVVDPVFFICLCMQMSGRKKSHRWKSDWQWLPPPIAILAVAWTQAEVVNSNSTSTGNETRWSIHPDGKRTPKRRLYPCLKKFNLLFTLSTDKYQRKLSLLRLLSLSVTGSLRLIYIRAKANVKTTSLTNCCIVPGCVFTLKRYLSGKRSKKKSL